MGGMTQFCAQFLDIYTLLAPCPPSPKYAAAYAKLGVPTTFGLRAG